MCMHSRLNARRQRLRRRQQLRHREAIARRVSADTVIVHREEDRRATVRRVSADTVIVHREEDRRVTVRKASADMVIVHKAADRKVIVRKASADSVTDRKATDRRAEWQDRRTEALIRTVSLIRMRIRMQFSRRDRQLVVVMTAEAVRQAALKQILRMS